MIKKAILLTLLLFILYSIFVNSFAPKWWHASQHQWQENMIKAQTFIYGNTDAYKSVVVGSSLSRRLVMDILPQTYNMSFAALGIFDGLNILTISHKTPPTVFIEMNYVLRMPDKNFAASIQSPILYYPRKLLVSLRDDKQPVAILGDHFGERITQWSVLHVRSLFHLPNPNNIHVNNTELFSKMITLKRKEYSLIPGEVELNESFGKLKMYIAELKKNNVQVVFFEMPVDSTLNHLPKATIIREAFFKYFPTSAYPYIAQPDSARYSTTDGEHLNEGEALRYTLYFKTKMKELIPEN